MRKTAPAYRYDPARRKWERGGEITCEVRGVLEDGRRIWEDLEDGQQYLLFRDGIKGYFTHI